VNLVLQIAQTVAIVLTAPSVIKDFIIIDGKDNAYNLVVMAIFQMLKKKTVIVSNVQLLTAFLALLQINVNYAWKAMYTMELIA